MQGAYKFPGQLGELMTNEEEAFVELQKLMKRGFHIRFANKRVDNYVVYELWDDTAFITAAYGPGAVGCLAAVAAYWKEHKKLPIGTDMIFLDSIEDMPEHIALNPSSIQYGVGVGKQQTEGTILDTGTRRHA